MTLSARPMPVTARSSGEAHDDGLHPPRGEGRAEPFVRLGAHEAAGVQHEEARGGHADGADVDHAAVLLGPAGGGAGVRVRGVLPELQGGAVQGGPQQAEREGEGQQQQDAGGAQATGAGGGVGR